MKRHENWSARWLAALQRQHDLYFDKTTRTIRPEYAEYTDCPSCGSKESRLYFEKDWFRYHECGGCSLVYMNPRLNHAATQQFYNSDVNEIYNETKFHDPLLTKGDDERNLANVELMARYRAKKGGKLLEIGCAKGFFLSKAREQGYEPYGLELNKGIHALARDLIGDTVYDKDLFEVEFPAGMFDVVYMRDLIEHIPNPRPFLDEVNRVAANGAVVVLETHNVRGLIHRIVGKKHTVIFGFEHPVHWSPASVKAALAGSGFEVEGVEFVSPDFTIRDVLGYAGPPTFTTILPRPVGWLRRNSVRAVTRALSVPGVRWLDRKLVSPIANAFGAGSVMKVVARKTRDVA